MSKHEIVGELGRGAMGVVYRARHVELGREVALKLVDPSVRTEGSAGTRFHREVKLLSELSHPHIVRVYDSGELEGRPYFTMEILEGEDLGQATARRGPIPVDEVAQWMIAAADALAHVHQRGHTHRDIKPSNLMVTVEGRVVVTDFGLVHVDGATVLTRTGELAGTPRYMAPEMLSGAPPSPAQDVWALALCTHELITGQMWSPVTTMRELIDQIVQGEPPAVEKVRGDVPAWLAEAQRRALAKDPAARATAAEYRDLLKLRGRRDSGRAGLAARRSGPHSGPAPGVTPRGLMAPASDPHRTPLAISAGSAPAAPGSYAARLAAAVVITGLGLFLAHRALSPVRPAARPAEAALAVVPGIGRSARVTLAADPPPGARLVARAGGVALARTPATSRTLVLDELPPDTAMTLALEGTVPEVSEPWRSPPVANLVDFRFATSDTTLLVGFHFRKSQAATVQIGTWSPRVTLTTANLSLDSRTFNRTFTGLSPDTDYFIRVTPEGRFGGLPDFRVRTWTRRWGESYRRILRDTRRANLDEATVLLGESPDASAAAHVSGLLQGMDLTRMTSLRHVAWLARATLHRPLVDRLLPALFQDIGEGTKSSILRAAMEVGHPDVLDLCARVLPELTENYSREQVGLILAERGPAAYDALLASFERFPEHAGILQALPVADPVRAGALFAGWIAKPLPAEETHALRCMVLGLARGAVPDSAQLLGKLLDGAVPDWMRRRAVDGLVELDGPQAAAEVARAYAAAPDSETLEWGVVRTGALVAAPLLAARVKGAATPAERRRAAFACGALLGSSAAPPPAYALTALRDACAGSEASVASAAAWALGHLGDAGAARALAARAAGPDDPEGFAAWALVRATRDLPERWAGDADALLKRLAVERDDSTAGLTRRALVAYSAAEHAARAADPPSAGPGAAAEPGTAAASPRAAAARARVLTALGPGPTPMLRQAVEGPPRERFGGVIWAGDLFPQIPYLRLPFTLHPGDSLDLRGPGWLALPGGQLKIAAAIQRKSETPTEDALTPCVYMGATHPRLTSVFSRVEAPREGAVILSCYEVYDGACRSAPLLGAAGWVRAFASR